MDILSNAVNSYQNNQRLSNTLNGAEAAAIKGTNDSEKPLLDDAISISSKRDVFDWIAREFPQKLDASANLNRLNQTLHDYGVLTLADINRVNQLEMDSSEDGLLQSLEAEQKSTTSFTQHKQLQHLIQVYSTITAAQQRAA